MNKHLKIMILTIIILALVAVPIIPTNAIQRDHQRGGTLHVGVVSEPVNVLNPALCFHTNYPLYIFSSLIQWDENGQLVGDLAEEWSVSEDGLKLTYVLKQGLKFSDGNPITSADVAYSVKVATEQSPLWLNYYQLLTEDSEETSTGKTVREGAIETPDPQTVIFNLHEPSSTALIKYGGHYILPKHVFEGHNIAAPEEREFFYDNLVSSGIFTLNDYVTGSHWWLERNENYHTPAYLDGLIFKVYADVVSAEIALINGEIDYIYGWPTQDWMTLSQHSQLALQLNPSWDVRFVWFNHDVKLVDGTPNPCSDIRVRKAIYKAIDIPAILNATICAGFYNLISELQPFFLTVGEFPVRDPDLSRPLFPYDPEGAKALLKDAGYENGMKLIYVLQAGSASNLAIAKFFQSYLADVGIELEIISYNPGAFYAEIAFRKHPMSWNLAYGEINCSPDAYVGPYYVLHQEMIGVWNWGGYNSSEVSALLDAGFTEIDEEKRAQLYIDANAIAAQDVALIYLYNGIQTVAYNKEFKGWKWIAHPMQGRGMGLYPYSIQDIYYVPAQQMRTVTEIHPATQTIITEIQTATQTVVVAEFTSIAAILFGLTTLFTPFAVLRRRNKN